MHPIHPQEQAPTEALFRYQVVSQVLTKEHMGELRPEAVDAVSNASQFTFDGQARTVSTRTIYRWLAAYEENGFAGLLPKPRITGPSYVLSDQLLDFFKEQKENDPRASVPELIRRAKELHLITADTHVDRTTVWRSLRRMGINTQRRKYPKKQRDSRRFAYPHRMDMVLCDGKHFRAGPNRLKRVALFFIDDATRMLLGVVVGTAESSDLFLRGLYQVVKTYGLMTAIYFDKGSGFRAHDTINVLTNLGILSIHGTEAYPQGHGKIERFNQTAKEQVLRLLDGNPEIDPDCSALTLRLGHYINHQYNQTPHESLKQETPWSRFHNDAKKLNFVESSARLKESFILHEKRRVSNDNVIPVDGIHYEMPRGHAGSRVVIRRNTLDNSISFIDLGRLVTLSPVPLHDNARDKRCRGRDEEEPPRKPTKSSAEIAFNRDMKPIVDASGGFGKANPNEEI